MGTTIRNSWSSLQGEDGYVRMLRGVGQDGLCGITSRPCYPIIFDDANGLEKLHTADWVYISSISQFIKTNSRLMLLQETDGLQATYKGYVAHVQATYKGYVAHVMQPLRPEVYERLTAYIL
ncbi:hypothetical protein L1049_020895 [Liquidambar formosana]|uniref:Peptidase C1A papain C-terminal domain-containing protein n=1 Tax=Liquidambar formosana TaxID=63359 RepID=A0AAP0X4Q4_LIQFO